MKEGKLTDIIFRYSILVVVGIFNTEIFYFIFLPATIFPVYFLLKAFFSVSINLNSIMINGMPIQIIGACVAASAYYLLLILTLSMPNLNLKKRIGVLLFSFSSLLVVNILRIFLLAILYVQGVSFFDVAHQLFWYAGSVIFVVLIWFLSVKIFKIKEIPLYSDFFYLVKSGKIGKSSGKKPKKAKSSKKH